MSSKHVPAGFTLGKEIEPGVVSEKFQRLLSTDKYRHCNHFHEPTDRHQLVDFGDGEFIANIDAIPLLKALNELGLKTRSHHVERGGPCFVSILLDSETSIEVRIVHECDADRTKFNGKTELLIRWEC